MNDKPQDNPMPAEPLDGFDTAWARLLAEPEQDLIDSGDRFVASVMRAYDTDPSLPAERDARPGVAGRIGVLPYAAAAAALVIATLIGWYVLGGKDANSNNKSIASNNANTAPDVIDAPSPADPTDPSPAAPRIDPSRLKLGELIAQTRATVTAPATDLPNAVRESPQALRIERLLNLFDNPVPDLQKLLPQREASPQQSRA